jgi:anti-sigma factor RsiW
LVELVTEYFEMTLSEMERERFERHLAVCEGCRRYVEQLRVTVRTLGALSAADLSPDVQAKLLEVFRTWRSM